MRPIDLIVVHCTATPEGKQQTVADITRMHKARGFSTIGYHWLIGINGEIWPARPETQVGAHVENYNRRSIGVSYVGGVKADGKTAKDTRTPAQKASLVKLLKELVVKYPAAKIVGHRDLSPDRNRDGVITPDEWIKQCPCFNAITEYRSIKLPVGAKNMPLALDPEVLPEVPVASDDAIVGPDSPRDLVKTLQKLLAARNYQVGGIDGIWGQLTRDAVLALKAENGLDTGEPTIRLSEARNAAPRVLELRQAATVADLRANGSETIKNTDRVQTGSVITGALGVAGAGAKAASDAGVLDHAEGVSNTASRWLSVLEPFQGLLPWIAAHWVYLIIPGAGVAWYLGRRTAQKRLGEYKTGKMG